MSATLPVRVMVYDAWDTLTLDVPPSMSLGDLKREALTQARVRGDPGEYVVWGGLGGSAYPAGGSGTHPQPGWAGGNFGRPKPFPTPGRLLPIG